MDCFTDDVDTAADTLKRMATMAVNLIDKANITEVVMADVKEFTEFRTSIMTSVAVINKELARLIKVIDGNGREGLIARIARIEEQQNAHLEQHHDFERRLEELKIGQDGLAKSVGEIKMVLDEIRTIKSMFWNKDTIKTAFLVVAGISIVVNLLMTNGMTVWSFLMKLFGL